MAEVYKSKEMLRCWKKSTTHAIHEISVVFLLGKGRGSSQIFDAMKPNRFSPARFFFPFSILLLFFLDSCSGVKTSGNEQDDAYYSSADRNADRQAAAKAAEQERKNEEEARARAQAQAESSYRKQGEQPDYVNPEYRASGQAPLAPQTSQGTGNIINNYYQTNPRWDWGFGFSPYTSMGYNWMYPGFSGVSWRVSSFWGPMWATSCFNTWDYGFGYGPFNTGFYNPYFYNPFAWNNPWTFRPFYRFPAYYGGSYWDNFQPGSGGGGSGGTGGRVKTNLPLGGTGTGVYGGGPSGGRNTGGRTGGREAVSGSCINSGGSISSGTREDRPARSSVWRRNGNLSEYNSAQPGTGSSGSGISGGTREQQSEKNSSSNSFWRGSQRSETSTGRSSDSRSSHPASSSSFYNSRSHSSPSSSGWGSGTTGGKSRSTSPSSGGPSGGRRR